MGTSRWVAIGAVLGAIGVAMGAFGAHALKTRLDAERLAVWETAARYELVHAVALIAAAWAIERWPGAWTSAVPWLFLAGIALFSGSLFVLALTGVRALGAVTPVGGLCFIAGWLSLAVGALRGR